eukprot:CAMPEP_0194143040 /NCGR_PEP_ID=MMETSP0152-20130528/12251_1 /TAXON_ID=1049557 /ORGANISM="Thalassiothrix antarctica, Strain L6-D1" /LENGTH=281 /DNA_ID=CAMNT_0038842269 /DNA_START=32 /DNA_END=877 /DNA_ORIENTATION=+
MVSRVEAFNYHHQTRLSATQKVVFSSESPDEGSPAVAVIEEEDRSTIDTTANNKAEELKVELMALAESTKRGFEATQEERNKATRIIKQLETMNPTSDPASPYYPDVTGIISGPNVCGKWTLVYTDAPDITSLDRTTPTATLGRIGQECNPPYVKNVIEWKRPEWAAALPFSGNDDSRIVQKICTKATASPDDPLTLDLKLAGIELVNPDASSVEGNFFDSISNSGLPAGLLQQNGPISIEGPLTAPFGKAKILYLDDTLRILRTFQNYYAVNVRSDPEWF